MEAGIEHQKDNKDPHQQQQTHAAMPAPSTVSSCEQVLFQRTRSSSRALCAGEKSTTGGSIAPRMVIGKSDPNERQVVLAPAATHSSSPNATLLLQDQASDDDYDDDDAARKKQSSSSLLEVNPVEAIRSSQMISLPASLGNVEPASLIPHRRPRDNKQKQQRTLLPAASGTRRLRRKFKPKDMPTRPLSAYNIFFRHQRKSIKADQVRHKGSKRASVVVTSANSSSGGGEDGISDTSDTKPISHNSDPLGSQADEKPSNKNTKASIEGHHPVTFEDASKVIARRWKDLSVEQAAYYHHLSELDKKRYKQEMDEYYQSLSERVQQEISSSAPGGTKQQLNETSLLLVPPAPDKPRGKDPDEGGINSTCSVLEPVVGHMNREKLANVASILQLGASGSFDRRQLERVPASSSLKRGFESLNGISMEASFLNIDNPNMDHDNLISVGQVDDLQRAVARARSIDMIPPSSCLIRGGEHNTGFDFLASSGFGAAPRSNPLRYGDLLRQSSAQFTSSYADLLSPRSTTTPAEPTTTSIMSLSSLRNLYAQQLLQHEHGSELSPTGSRQPVLSSISWPAISSQVIPHETDLQRALILHGGAFRGTSPGSTFLNGNVDRSPIDIETWSRAVLSGGRELLPSIPSWLSSDDAALLELSRSFRQHQEDEYSSSLLESYVRARDPTTPASGAASFLHGAGDRTAGHLLDQEHADLLLRHQQERYELVFQYIDHIRRLEGNRDF